ncbi:MAG: A/G-specific adenine glycosylase [Saprospiraceae bacterium]
MKEQKDIFRLRLMAWYAQSKRPLPWKGEKNPYLIWLSEIILQQTRVEQGLPYFEKFKAYYPDVHLLANASEDEVMKHWEGLGYYSRARNMHATAQYISQELKGQFPNTYEGIANLKGVGPYTAAAIASFAFDLPHAVLDGNVFRVLSRYFGIDSPIDQTPGKKQFATLAQTILDIDQPGLYNQAIMDFGATQCTPKNPNCKACPMQDACQAFLTTKVDQFPVKAKKMVRKERFFHYLVFEYEHRLFLQRRESKDIWKHLYQFPLVEHDQFLERFEILQQQPQWPQWVSPDLIEAWTPSRPFRQELTHQRINALFFHISLNKLPIDIPKQFLETDQENLSKFAFPKIIDLYLTDKSLYLKLL